MNSVKYAVFIRNYYNLTKLYNYMQGELSILLITIVIPIIIFKFLILQDLERSVPF